MAACDVRPLPVHRSRCGQPRPSQTKNGLAVGRDIRDAEMVSKLILPGKLPEEAIEVGIAGVG
jgi:hypothetical protein